jgi:hypothetical protein
MNRPIRWLSLVAVLIAVGGARGQSMLKSVACAGFSASENAHGSLHGSFGQPVIGYIANTLSLASIGFWASSGSESVSRVEGVTPAGITLHSIAPNPLHDATTVRFDLKTPGDVIFRLIATNGEIVKTEHLADRQAGPNQFAFTPGNLPAGTYQYSLTDGKSTLSGTMTILK